MKLATHMLQHPDDGSCWHLTAAMPPSHPRRKSSASVDSVTKEITKQSL